MEEVVVSLGILTQLQAPHCSAVAGGYVEVEGGAAGGGRSEGQNSRVKRGTMKGR